MLRAKHAVDRTVAMILLALLSPLLAACAIAIGLEDGRPVVFIQRRLGQHASPFDIIKFRTMIHDADSFLNADGSASRDRVTKVGRWLRLMSLDELPQLVNILRGEMSLVGPRPVLPSHLPRYTDEQKRRFEMRPGVTGLAQVQGRNTVPWSERLRYDVEYVTNWSPALDARIIARTVTMLFTGKGVVLDRNPGAVDDLPVEAPAEGDRG